MKYRTSEFGNTPFYLAEAFSLLVYRCFVMAPTSVTLVFVVIELTLNKVYKLYV